MGGTIFSTELSKRLAAIPEYASTLASGASSMTSYTSISHIEPASLRNLVEHAYTRSLALIYIVSTPISFVGLLFSEFYSFSSISNCVLDYEMLITPFPF